MAEPLANVIARNYGLPSNIAEAVLSHIGSVIHDEQMRYDTGSPIGHAKYEALDRLRAALLGDDRG